MKEPPLLHVQDLEVRFHRDEGVSRVVDRVSYEVRQGETVCLVGESGCGKTVSALSILGLIPSPPGQIAGGHVWFHGKDLLTLPEEALQGIRGKRISMVFQEPLTSLNPVFTIGDQIREGIQIHEAVSEEEAMGRCVELLRSVGIPSPEARMADYPHQLSGGQRQRVMIAMAMACRPEVIIADEPTTALDVTVQAQILRLFKSLQERHGMAIIYITHDLGVVANVADRVYVMYAGVIVEQGATARLFRDSRHPYTRGLLSALPRRDRRDERLAGIPGAVPDPARKPAGCPFHPRCPWAETGCRKAFPEMVALEGDHWTRCPVLAEKEVVEG